MKPPAVSVQGVVFVERGNDGELLVGFPDGSVEVALSSEAALAKARRWFGRRQRRNAINVGRIEWRHGLVPPNCEPKGGAR